MFRRNPTLWSCCEVDYLKANKDSQTQSQLSGYLGKSLNAVKNKIKEIETGIVVIGKPKSGKKSKIGRREDLNLFVRSAWEANVLRWLKHTGKAYTYEPKVFSFIEHGVKHGTVSYTPDVLVSVDKDTSVWIEIKGYLKTEDKTKLRRFKKFFPEEFAKLQVIIGSANTKTAEFFDKLGVPVYAYYNDLNKKYRNIIEGWE